MSFLVKQLMKSAVGQAAGGRAGERAATPANGSSAHSAAGPSHAAEVRTLMLRVQSCEIAQDRRDALTELSRIENLGHHMTVQQVAVLMETARNLLGIDMVAVATILEIFAAVTDPNDFHNPNREEFLANLVDASFFIGFLDDSNFWVKYHSVKMLQRLEDVSPSTLHKQLLASHGMHAVIDVLNDGSNGGVLRNEGLVLLTALTQTDQELQTIVAFENGFESLFQIITEEGGLAGGVIVSDCLSTVVNMLRGNNATQKFFREMGIARSLNPLLSAVAPSATEIAAADKHRDNRNAFPEYAAGISADASLTLQRCVTVLQFMLKGSDMNGEGAAVRNSLMQCSVLAPLTTVALSERVDKANQAEALRTLAALVHKSKGCCDALAQARIPQRYGDGPWFVGSALWATLRLMLGTTDAACQVASASILASVTDSPGSSVSVGSFLMKNLAKPPTAHLSLPLLESAAASGVLMAAALFQSLSGASQSATYYAAVVLQQVLMIPQLTEQMLYVPWEGNTVTFFPAYVHHVIRMINAKQTDLCTLSALIRPIVTCLTYTSKAAPFLLADDTVFTFFLDWSSQARDTIHCRFLCLVVAAVLATSSSTHHQGPRGLTHVDPSPTSTSDVAHSLQRRFDDRTSRGKRLEDLFLDVQESEDWRDAPSNAWSSNPCVYDLSWKRVLVDITQPIRARAATAATEATTTSTKPVLPKEMTTAQIDDASHPSSDNERLREAKASVSQAAASSTSAAFVPARRSSALDQDAGSTSEVARMNGDLGSQDRTSTTVTSAVTEDSSFPAAGNSTQLQMLREEMDKLKQQLLDKETELAEVKMQSSRELSNYQGRCAELERELQRTVNKTAEVEAQFHDTVALLEEALHTKEDEARQLASSLSMLESRLQSSQLDSREAIELRNALDATAMERDELLILVAELDEEREFRRAAGDASAISPPRTVTDIDVSPARPPPTDDE